MDGEKGNHLEKEMKEKLEVVESKDQLAFQQRPQKQVEEKMTGQVKAIDQSKLSSDRSLVLYAGEGEMNRLISLIIMSSYAYH